MSRAFSPWLAMLLLTGCAHGSALRERAGFDLGCPEEQLVISEAGGAYRARGCARAAEYHCNTHKWRSRCKSAAAAPAAPADADVPSGATPRGAALNRAVVDLSCPESQLRFIYFDTGGVGVSGCGKRLAYVCRQRFWRYWCAADSAILVGERPK